MHPKQKTAHHRNFNDFNVKILEGHVKVGVFGANFFFMLTKWGGVPRLKVMLRNLPNNYTREMLLTLLNDKGFAGRSLELFVGRFG